MDDSELTHSGVWVHHLPHLQAGNKGSENSPEVKDLGVPATKKLNISQPKALEAQKVPFILGWIKSSEASRAKEEFLPFCSSLLRPLLQGSVQLQGS